ncbi:protein TolQ [Microbulbifer sp. EKSA008]|uniref:protein TolQ n=1 Tax=unclassified Microbulbifer TaxID=2619833 RepID=UPI000D52C0C2|nr:MULTISPECIES: protein TolQ [unclassified Microbulbifer]AWF79990.1 protein TolQ [Microbulbifer sp. A4B17]WHI48668.1 protein TolQ [Microbulbifer sp. VAAF005]WNZ57134.1 protein TolQ [Microbulbifer sp. MKSA007]
MNAGEQLSLWGLIQNASLLVQLVMLLLLLASVVSWVMIIQRGLYLSQAKRSLNNFERRFWSGADLNKLFREGNERAEKGRTDGVESLFRAGFTEFTRLRQQGSSGPEAVMEGTERAMRVAMSREQEKVEMNLPFLATVGSVSPYIGLFGTVWGIMNSFRGLATMHQATIATVAPGISEALVATAMGLFAAIPAVMAFNRYSAKAESLLSSYETFAEEFSSILHRKVHSG